MFFKQKTLSLICVFSTAILNSCSSGTSQSNTSNILPNITLQAINSSNLPALQEPIVVRNGDYWLILGGLNNAMHEFSYTYTNPNISVYNPQTNQIYTKAMDDTDLPNIVKQQIRSSSQISLRDRDTLYVIGGYYNSPIESTSYTTINTISSFNISGVVDAVLNNESNIAQFVHYNSNIPEFRVTGGDMGKIRDHFYLAFGQVCEGNYCSTSQVYTNTIYKFTMDSTLTSITIESSISRPELDGSGFRRRDYNLVPFMLNTTETLFAMGGPFTPGEDANVWTNGISIEGNLNYNLNFINQQANQYMDGHLSMYSQSTATSYVATFSGLSNLYWDANGSLVYDGTTPYGNVLDLIRADSQGNIQEFANTQALCSGQALNSCLYMGLDAKFIPQGDEYNERLILQLDELPSTSPTLVGYLYGGLSAESNQIFDGGSYSSNQAYAVYVTAPAKSNSWVNITNMYLGN